ncbi:MAG: hypothetical protein H7Z72_01860 [Bacteroidetes bacterium]|nr:hypothetical protein [Fibrella sp.]
MNWFLKLISYTGLVLTALPGLFVFLNLLSFQSYTQWLLAGSLLWFGSAPFWVSKADGRPDEKPATR